MDDYYDIDAILAEQQRIPSTLLVDIPGLGLDEQNGGGDMQANSTVELPYWIAETLAANDFIELQMPKPFSARMRRILQASCTNVNFHTLCPYFYEFGLKLAVTFDEPQLNDLLAEVYRKRLELILDAAQRADSQNMAEFVSQLDESEKKVYILAKQSTQSIRQWQKGQLYRLQMADVLKAFRGGGQ
ncbi:DNA replication protein [Dimargaris cristalligena]|nr:DNA replication protein [Dimargaris cristalligena]